MTNNVTNPTFLAHASFVSPICFHTSSLSTYLKYFYLVGVRKYVFSSRILMPLSTKVYWSILHY
jgi:hypothetical protein